ncbi:hypothetical protein ABVT39_023432 [Epinephelus coioides]
MPKIDGIQGRSSSNPVAPEIRAPYVEGIVHQCPSAGDSPSVGITNSTAVFLTVVGDQRNLLDPPVLPGPEEAVGPEDDSGEGPSHSNDDDEETVSARDSELQDDIRTIYKQYLSYATEYKKFKIKKIKLEIKKMEKDRDGLTLQMVSDGLQKTTLARVAMQTVPGQHLKQFLDEVGPFPGNTFSGVKLFF